MTSYVKYEDGADGYIALYINNEGLFTVRIGEFQSIGVEPSTISMPIQNAIEFLKTAMEIIKDHQDEQS
jgi:hypothetical protein